jgi:hypothetical protein
LPQMQSSPKISVPRSGTGRRLVPPVVLHPSHALMIVLFAVFVALMYSKMLEYRTFGPEYAQYYVENVNRTFGDVVRSYRDSLGSRWYRPTQFVTLYWLVSRVIDWHNLVGFQVAFVGTMFGACCALYWFMAKLLPQDRIAGLLACAYVASHPASLPSILQLTAFDFFHIAVILVSVILFLGAREAQGRRAVWMRLGSFAAFAVALTSKEVAIVLPVYLAAACLLTAWWHRNQRPMLVQLRHDAAWLAPFFALLLIFYAVHLRHRPPEDVYSPYHTGIDWAAAGENLRKFPQWTARIFDDTGDTQHQADAHDRDLNNVFGWVSLLAVIFGWIGLWRHNRETRLPGMLLLLWLMVFFSVPLVSGSWLWHINLPMVAYAGLFGIAIARLCGRLRGLLPQIAALVAVCAYLAFSGRVAIADCYERNVHRWGYSLARGLIDAPPVSGSRLGSHPFLYMEDVVEQGPWHYGAAFMATGKSNLFQLVYNRPGLEEWVVPPRAKITALSSANWLLRGSDAFFFTYDQRFHWYDDTARFRAFLESRPVTLYTEPLIAEHRWADVIRLLEPRLAAERSNTGVLYHYGLALHQLSRPAEALDYYSRALALDPNFAYPRFHRGELELQTGRKREACADLRAAQKQNRNFERLAEQLAAACR